MKFIKAGPKKQRFTLHAFSFIKKSRQIYIHCVLFICRKSSNEAQCTRGCNGNNVKRVRRDVDEATSSTRTYSKYFLLDIGPIQRDYNLVYEANEPSKGKAQGARRSVFFKIKIMFFRPLVRIGTIFLCPICDSSCLYLHLRPLSSGCISLETTVGKHCPTLSNAWIS